MNDFADRVQIVETYKTLFGDLSGKLDRAAVVIVLFDQFKKVYTQDLKHHTEMIAIWTFVDEGIEQLNNVAVVPAKCFLL